MNNTLNLAHLRKFSILLKANESKFTVSTGKKLLFTGNITDIEQVLSEVSVQYEKDLDGYTLNIKSLSQHYKVIYYKWIDQDLGRENVGDQILVLDTNGDFALFSNGVLEEHSDNINFKILVLNLLAYYRLQNVLQNEELSDHNNELKEEYVFYSSTKGVIKIKYDTVAPKLDKEDLTSQLNHLISLISQPQYKSYFINSLFKIAKEKTIVNLTDIIIASESLVSIIKRDYELILKQFDFENFKDKLLKEKDKYFNSIREILSKVFSQLVGIPISISASAFATYKVEDEPVTLILILVGFVFYVIIYLKIQTIYKVDINDLEGDFNRDFEIIKEKSGLPIDVINSQGNKIKGKIAQTRTMINWLMTGIIMLGLSFVIYLTNQILISWLGHNSFLKLIISTIFGC